ncbi:MAG: response regulator [Acidobacteriota bacterium]
MNQSISILLVEDEEPVRRMLAEALSRRGYRIATASSGLKGLESTHRLTADIATIDWALNDRVGQDVADRLREKSPHLVTLLISGYTKDVLIRRGLVRESAEFLEKPFPLVALENKSHRLLDSAPRPRATGP